MYLLEILRGTCAVDKNQTHSCLIFYYNLTKRQKVTQTFHLKIVLLTVSEKTPVPSLPQPPRQVML